MAFYSRVLKFSCTENHWVFQAIVCHEHNMRLQIICVFAAPPKRPTKRLMKSLPSDVFLENNLVPMAPLKYSGLRDASDGGFDHLNGVPKSKNYQRGQVSWSIFPWKALVFTAHLKFSKCFQSNTRYRRRTTDDFLQFVDAILDYTNYEQMRQQVF